MTELAKKYYSKVLLFGEYTVTLGSGALAIPYSGYWGYWDFGSGNTDDQVGLLKLYQHLIKSDKLQDLYKLKNFKDDLDKGLFFSSNIPQGYGLGSSGALVAGIYDRYAVHKVLDYNQLKKVLAETEGAFHGSSSGVDPLVSYLNTPVLIDSTGHIMSVNSDMINKDTYLLDTGIERTTDVYIEIFKNKLKTDEKFTHIVKQISKINEKAISATLYNNSHNLYAAFGQISTIQYEYFREMIPECLSVLWQEGLYSQKHYLKLCGAGGGGMMLCMAKSSKELTDKLKSLSLHYMSISPIMIS